MHSYFIKLIYPHFKGSCQIKLTDDSIAITPIGIPSRLNPEPSWKTLRDPFRSILWVFTGRRFLRFHPRERNQPTQKLDVNLRIVLG